MRANAYSQANLNEQDLVASEFKSDYAIESLPIGKKDRTFCKLTLNPWQSKRLIWAFLFTMGAPANAVHVVFSRNGQPVLSYPIQISVSHPPAATLFSFGLTASSQNFNAQNMHGFYSQLYNAAVYLSPGHVFSIADAAEIKAVGLGGEFDDAVEAALQIYSEIP